MHLVLVKDSRKQVSALRSVRRLLGLVLGLTFAIVVLEVSALSGPAQAGDEGFPDSASARANLGLSQTISPTLSTFLPVVNRWNNIRSLGQVTLNSGPVSCPGGQCYNVTVICPEVADPIKADLKVGGPSDNTKAGTLFFASGYTGAYFWDFSSLTSAEMSRLFDPSYLDMVQSAPINNPIIIQNLQADGYQTVQVKWEAKGWYTSKPSVIEGQARLACRPATLAKWVYEQFHQNRHDQPYCAIGQSNGATQVSLSLAHYGLAEILAGVVLESGPNWSRIDYACLWDPVYFYLMGDTLEIDKAFGGSTGIQPCGFSLQAHRSTFEEASLMFGNWDFQYPNTMVSFVFGGNDAGTTAKHGLFFYDYLSAQSTPYLSKAVVAGAGHFVTGTTDGMIAVENAIRTSCVLH